MHQAETHLADLARRAEDGEEIVIARGGTPVVRLVAFAPSRGRRLRFDQGAYTAPEDFDAPLPDDVLDLFA